MKVAADSNRCLYAQCLYLFEQAFAQGIRGTKERLRAGDVDYAGKVTVTALIFHPGGEAAGTLQQDCSSRASSAHERNKTRAVGNISISNPVMPKAIPNVRAAALREHTCSNGGSPSSTATGLPCNSGRRRESACRGNSFTSTQAYRSVKSGLPKGFCPATALLARFVAVSCPGLPWSAGEIHSQETEENADGLTPPDVRDR